MPKVPCPNCRFDECIVVHEAQKRMGLHVRSPLTRGILILRQYGLPLPDVPEQYQKYLKS